MSDKYSKVLKYYKLGAWTTAMVKNAVVKGWITEDEYQTITGETYTED